MSLVKAQVINAHWYGGSDKLPPNSRLIDRTTPYGNRHKIIEGKYSREDCVAFHRVNLYQQLVEQPSYLLELRQALGGYDLACWCKQKHKAAACHGDNYHHILSDELQDRTYDRTVWFYLFDDLKKVFGKIDRLITNLPPERERLFFWIGLLDCKVDIEEMIRLFAVRETDPEMCCLWLATVIIDLEMVLQETQESHQLYRLDHCSWNCFRFTYRPQSRSEEPSPPDLKVRKPKHKEAPHDRTRTYP